MEVDFDEGSEGTLNSASSGPLSEEDDCFAQLMVLYPNREAVPYKLHCGINVIGRQSSFAQRDATRLHAWSAEYHDSSVHGVFLESSSVSSAHALICVEDRGRGCYVEDLRSRNKTFIKQANRHVAIDPGRRVPLHDASSLTFGALKCRINLEAAKSEGDFGTTERSQGRPLSARPLSRALSIGQRTIPPISTSGRASFLDKCPSLQEWFQHPAAVRGQEGLTLGSMRSTLSQAEEPKDLPQKHSFGFEVTDNDDHTSSDGEPETPRIDKPAIRPFSKSPASPFKHGRNPLESTITEDQDEQHTAAETGSGQLAESWPSSEAPGKSRDDSDEGLSMVMGAEALTQLRTSPASPSGAGTSGLDVPAPKLQALRRGSPGLTDAEADLHSGRPHRAMRQKSPSMKRSRSGRIASPEKSQQPRSKSPRLQRLKSSGQSSEGGDPPKVDDIRAAMQDLLAPTTS